MILGPYSPTQLRQQADVLRALDDRWLSVAEVRARTPATVRGRDVQYRLRELRTRGLADYREDEVTRTGRWRRHQVNF